MQVGSWL